MPDPLISHEQRNATGVGGLIEVEHAVAGPVEFGAGVTPVVFTSALTLGVGLCQMVMALCRLSFLVNYISDPLVAGFTTGRPSIPIRSFARYMKAIFLVVKKIYYRKTFFSIKKDYI